MFFFVLTGVCVLLLVYVLLVYPVLLAWLASRYPLPVKRAPLQPRVSILLAVYNGENFLREKLNSLLALDYPSDRMEILVLSDGSTDHTEEIARAMEPRGVRLLALPRGGKPSALNAGMAVATGDFFVMTDVRQTVDPQALNRIMERFSDPAVGVVSGALIIRDFETGLPSKASAYWRYEIRMRDHLSAIGSIFGATGALYAIRRELAVPIPREILLDDMYLPLAAFFRGYRLVLEPAARIYDYPVNLRSEFDRKVRTLAGNYQILAAYPQLIDPRRNPLWWHFMSYKFARLLLPFALIGVLIGSLGLPLPLRQAAFAPQVLIYGLAFCDRWIPDGTLLKKASGACATFVTLMLAGLKALSILFVPSERLWKRTVVEKSSVPQP